MLKEVIYATSNPGKILEVSKFLGLNGIKVISPKDLGINIDVSETGSTLEENAILKVKAFLKFSEGRIVLADDTGLEIDSLGGKPGIYVRRWKDGMSRMSDEEIIDYCIEQMKGIPLDQRGAQLRTVVALGLPDGKVETFDGVLRGIIMEKPVSIRVEGFPFVPLFFVPEWKMLLGEIHSLDIDKRGDKILHREKALKKVLNVINERYN